MTPISLAEVLRLAPGTIIPGVRGTIKAVCERASGSQVMSDQTTRDWSVQDIVLTDNGSEIVVKVDNHDLITPDKQGQSVFLLAHQKARGGMSGLKVWDEEGQIVLRLSKSGELVFGQPGDTISDPAAVSPAASPQPGAAPSPVPVSETVPPSIMTGTGGQAGKAKATVPGPVLFLVDTYSDIYQMIFKRMVGVKNSDLDGSVWDPQTATDTIFKAIVSKGTQS